MIECFACMLFRVLFNNLTRALGMAIEETLRGVP